MKTFLRIVAAFLLVVEGAAAFYGGFNLIAHPDGSSLQMPLSYLEHSPFKDYFYPGIILFVSSGLFSWFVLASLVLRLEDYPLLIIAQGAILSIWIMTEALMLQFIDPFHFLFGSAGPLLVLVGWMLGERENYVPGQRAMSE